MIPKDSFVEYLTAVYGKNVILPAINGDILFKRINILAPPWTEKFGYPFEIASLESDDYFINGSFGCLSSIKVLSGFGIITAIGSNYIECTNDVGEKYKLNISPCSRLEGSRHLPQISQKLFWSGTPTIQGFNLYFASCFY